VSVKIYVEGGGDSRGQQAPLRRAFSKLLRQFEGHMPSIVCGGSRLAAFNEFKRALADVGNDALLLVDAEGPISGDDG
jgi:ribosomal protein S9